METRDERRHLGHSGPQVPGQVDFIPNSVLKYLPWTTPYIHKASGCPLPAPWVFPSESVKALNRLFHFDWILSHVLVLSPYEIPEPGSLDHH